MIGGSIPDIKARIGLDGAEQFSAGAQNAGRSMAALAASTTRFGGSAQLTGQQTAQLSAQVQDFVVQLQGGANPLTAFLQQGSQLSAVFGGTGNALRAVATLVTPVAVGLGAVGAALGVVGVAFVKGEAERAAFVRGLVTTGNAAGATASQLAELAKSAASIGGRGAMADALAQLVQTGKVGADLLGAAGEAVVRSQRETGAAVKDTVKAFADLARDPLDAIRRLNDGQNFLTASTYRQIQALTEAGKTGDAARLAQETYASATTARMKELEGQLGAIETLWRSISGAARKGWDAILNIGRPDTLQVEFASLQAKLASAEAAPEGQRSADRTRFINEGRQRLEVLRAQVLAEMEVAQAQADGVRVTEKAIKAADADADARKKATEEIRRLTQAGRELVQAMDLESAGFAPGFLRDMQALQAAAKAAGWSQEKLREETDKLVQQQPFVQRQFKATTEQVKAYFAAREYGEQNLRELTESEDRRNQALAAETKALADRLQAMQFDAEAVREAAALNITLEQAIARVTLRRMEDRRAALVNDQPALDELNKQIATQRQIAEATNAKASVEANARAAEEAARAWTQTIDSIREGLTDAFRRAFESGEDFGTAFVKVIEREIKARIATTLAGALADGVLSLVGLTAAGAAGSSGQGGGSGNSAFGTASNLASMYTAGQRLYGSAQSAYNWGSGLYATYTGNMAGSTALYTGMANSQTLAAYGVKSAGATTGGVTGASSAGTTGGTSAGMYGLYAAIAIKSYQQAQKDYAEGFRTAQSRDAIDRYGPGISPAGGAETYVADLFRGLGMSNQWAEVLSGASHMARIFGRSAPQIQASGVAGTLANGGFEGQMFADMREKGGWLRSDKNWTEFAALPEDLGRFLSVASRSVFDEAQRFGTALGLPAQALAGVSTDIKLTLTDDVEANKKAITEALGGYGQKLVESWSEAVKPLAQYGETTVQTIERVGTAIGSVNDVLSSLGLAALQASIDGGKAALDLQQLFGNTDTLRGAAGSYLQNYYGDDERNALTRTAIGSALAQVNVAVPATREAFRSLVQAQDLTTESGRRAFAALMGVADAFAQITPAAQSAADAAAETARKAAEIAQERAGLTMDLLRLQGREADIRALLLEQIDPSNRALQQQVWALQDQQAAAQSAADAARTLAGAWAGLASGALGGVQSAYGVVAQAIDADRQRVQADAEAQLGALRQRSAEITNLFGAAINALGDAVARVSGNIAGDDGRGQAVDTLTAALAGLRSGQQVDMSRIGSAAAQAAQLGTERFASRADYDRALAQTGRLLRDVQTAASARLQSESFVLSQQQAAVTQGRDRQLAVLDQQLEQAREAAGALVSIDNGVQGVQAAIDRLAGSIGAALMLQNGSAAGMSPAMMGQWLTSGDVQVWGSTGGAIASRRVGAGAADTLIRGKDGSQFSVAEAQGWLRDRIAAGDFAGIVARAQTAGVDSAGVDALLGLTPGTALAEALRRGLPSFAVGTPFVPRDMVAQIHEGERIIPAADNAMLMSALHGPAGGGADLLAELVALREEVAALRAEQRGGLSAVAANTRRGAETLETWEAVGMPATVPA